jgi:hypothetical protein
MNDREQGAAVEEPRTEYFERAGRYVGIQVEVKVLYSGAG